MAEITEDNMDKEKYRWEESRCRICGAYHNNKTYTAKEMMYGTKEEFDYFICGNCGCMQIKKIPEDLGRYYKDNYYSMAERQVKFEGDAIYTKDRILDVGCGTGKYLLDLAEEGYGNLYGCDPFIEKDIHYGDRIYIKKGELNQMEGEFDCIRMNNSFEHIGTPLETMECVSRMLKKSGVCQICIPVLPNAAFDIFGVNWYQLDAPRHLFIHTKKSMEYICGKYGLKIRKVEYISDLFQFMISYYYELGVSLEVIEANYMELYSALGMEMIEYFKQRTEELNKKGYGDHACFYIEHA